MSLESLSSLKQLVQVREQGASIQNDNLETAQRQVQQVGTGEAKRVDELHLEAAKAEYEVALTQARVERLQSQLARENKAVENAKFITVGVSVLSVGSNLGNFFDDMNGAQKFGDQKTGDLKRDASGNVGKFDKSGNQLVLDSKGNAARFDKDGTQLDPEKFDLSKKEDKDKFMSGKIKVLDASGKAIEGGSFKEDDFKQVGNDRTINGQEFKKGQQITTGVTGDTTAAATYNVANNNGNLSIIRTPFSGAGDIGNSTRDQNKPNTGIRVGFISKNDLDEAVSAAKKEGKLSDSDIEAAGGSSFAALLAKDPSRADALFTKNSRDLQRNEADTAIGAIGSGGAGGKSNIYLGKDNKPINDPEEIKKFQMSITGNVTDIKGESDFSDEVKKRVEANLKATGVSGGGVGAMDALKYGANAVVSVVSDVSPFFQAYLKMKDQRDKTADELQAEVAKLAAGRKRLKAIEDAIRSPGAGADGSAAGVGQAAKA